MEANVTAPADLDEFQRRVEQYFQGINDEPGGRIILDLMRALRQTSETATATDVVGRNTCNPTCARRGEAMTDFLDRAENEIARLYAENTNLRTENNQLKNEMMSREIERLTGDRFEFHGELGDKVPALTSDEASLLAFRTDKPAADIERGEVVDGPKAPPEEWFVWTIDRLRQDSKDGNFHRSYRFAQELLKAIDERGCAVVPKTDVKP